MSKYSKGKGGGLKVFVVTDTRGEMHHVTARSAKAARQIARSHGKVPDATLGREAVHETGLNWRTVTDALTASEAASC